MTKKELCVQLTVTCIIAFAENGKIHDQTVTKLFFLSQNTDKK